MIIHDDPREIQLLVPLHRVAMLLLKEEFPVHFHLLALVIADAGDQVAESGPVRDAERDQTPSDRRCCEPRDFLTDRMAAL